MAAGDFGPPYILDPQDEHAHTAIVLHGRGSSGEEFAEEFMSSPLSHTPNLRAALPTWRWVFPTSQELWSSAFQETMPAWFEAHSLTDISARQEFQVSGIRDAVRYVGALVEDEIRLLNGHSEKLVLGGISQGAAVGLWTLLCSPPELTLGGFFASSTWLPFATDIEQLVTPRQEAAVKNANFEALVQALRPASLEPRPSRHPLSSTRMLMGHGSDDAYVDVSLGRHAARIFSEFGASVEGKEYTGAEDEGHWFKVPEQMDDIHRFLSQS